MPFGCKLSLTCVLPDRRCEQKAKDVINVVVVIYDDTSSIKHRVQAKGIVNPCGLADMPKQLSLMIKDRDQSVFRQPGDENRAVAQNAHGFRPIGRKGTEQLSID